MGTDGNLAWLTGVYRMVNETRVSQGVARLRANSELLTEISKKYGVPPQFLVSIWGIETK